jgi:hypothetical protein
MALERHADRPPDRGTGGAGRAPRRGRNGIGFGRAPGRQGAVRRHRASPCPARFSASWTRAALA